MCANYDDEGKPVKICSNYIIDDSVFDDTNNITMTIHKTGRYMYASTQIVVKEASSQLKRHIHLHWGSLDKNYKFFPGKNFYYVSPKVRNKLVFPLDWDISEVLKDKSYKPARSLYDARIDSENIANEVKCDYTDDDTYDIEYLNRF